VPRFLAGIIALAALLPLPALAQQQNFNLINRTGYTIAALNVSPTSQDSWGPDILGAAVIPNGQAALVRFQPGISACEFDVRITYATGDSSDVRNVSLCRASQITVTYDEDEEETNFEVE
jgi:hypothetical protein